MQTELLEKYSKADLRVYAVWFNMFPGDARSKWPPALLTDGRVIHGWDEGKLVGMWYGERTSGIRGQLSPGSSWNGDILWDAYLLYGADAKWDDDAPTNLIHWGRTIVGGRETLRHDFEQLFGAPRRREGYDQIRRSRFLEDCYGLNRSTLSTDVVATVR